MSFCLRIFKVSSFGSGSGSNQMESSEIRFGRFRLDLRRRTLLRDDLPVRLGGRPLDILCALASAGGDVLTQDELMARLWSAIVPTAELSVLFEMPKQRGSHALGQ